MGRNLRKRSSKEYTANPKPEKRKRKNSGLGDANVKFDWLTEQNTFHHHTDEYENEVLVVRRGGKINLGMTFEGIKFSEINETALRFCIEPKPRNFKEHFYIHCGIEDKLNDAKWGMKVLKKDPSKLQIYVEINIPVDTVIGRYSVDVVLPGFSNKFLNQSQIIILFNPWNKDDDVYLSDEKLREEYVLNDRGMIYRRPTNYGLDWNFGQFEEDILDCVLQLLEKDKRVKKAPLKSFTKRSSPAWVARVLSAVLNSQDEDGVLVGNWSGDYADGVPPSSWNGSVDILRQYFTTGKPVEYGQCWVFSGIMTTALRVLGIPARSVTNFDSAHDTDNTMTIDKYYNEDGDLLDDFSDDSVWNFHVWNEIWTKRKDLPEGQYDGWQAVDSTPQEESSQLYQMGPAPLKAVKNGEVYAGFDTGFVFSEVNADVVDWIVKQDEDNEIIVQKVKRVNSTAVGHYISTKGVGTDEREDVTHLYKYREGSQDEAKAFRTAYSFGHGAKNFVGHLGVEEEGENLTLDLSTSPDGIILNGDSFTCKINVKNTSKQKSIVKLTGVISSIQYTGKVKVLVKRKKFDPIKVDAGKTVSQEIHVDADEYLGKLTDLNCLKLVVVAQVVETGKRYVDDITFQLSNEKDCIKVKFLELPLKVGEPSKVDITFTNPLPITMSNVKFSIEGAGLTRLIRRSYKRRLGSGKKRSVRFTFSPRKPGNRTLLVDIDSSQAKDFKAVANVEVVEA